MTTYMYQQVAMGVAEKYGFGYYHDKSCENSLGHMVVLKVFQTKYEEFLFRVIDYQLSSAQRFNCAYDFTQHVFIFMNRFKPPFYLILPGIRDD